MRSEGSPDASVVANSEQHQPRAYRQQSGGAMTGSAQASLLARGSSRCDDTAYGVAFSMPHTSPSGKVDFGCKRGSTITSQPWYAYSRPMSHIAYRKRKSCSEVRPEM